MTKFKHISSSIEETPDKQFISEELKNKIGVGYFDRDWGFIHNFPDEVPTPDANYLEDLGEFSNHWILFKVIDVNQNYFYRFQLTYWEPGMYEPFYYIPDPTFSVNPAIALYTELSCKANAYMDYKNNQWVRGDLCRLDEYTTFKDDSRFYAAGVFDNRGVSIEIVGTSLARILDNTTENTSESLFEPPIGGITVSPKKALKFDIRSYRGVDGELVYNVSDSLLYVATPGHKQRIKEVILEDKFKLKGDKLRINGTKVELLSTTNGVEQVVSEVQLPNLGGDAGNLFEEVSKLRDKVRELELLLGNHMEPIL